MFKCRCSGNSIIIEARVPSSYSDGSLFRKEHEGHYSEKKKIAVVSLILTLTLFLSKIDSVLSKPDSYLRA